MKQRILTALIIILGVIPLFFSIEYLYLVLILIAFISSLELNDLISDDKYPLIIGLNFSLIISLGLDFIGSQDKALVLGIFLLVFVISDLVFNEIGFNNLALSYTVSILIGTALNAFMHLFSLSPYLILFLLLVNYGSDTAAYFVGSKFGKVKLIPKVSPNKTVEGSVAGVVFGGLLGIVFGLFFIDYSSIFHLAAVSFVLPVIGQLGDLFFSSLKRTFNRKDFGGLFPGHGGVLDRIDSLIFSLVFMLIFVSLGYIGIL